MNKALAERIEANRKDYYRLLNDSNYIGVRFNPNNGALLAIHKEHFFDPTIGVFKIPRGDYEKIASEVLFDYGMSIILDSEMLGYQIKNYIRLLQKLPVINYRLKEVLRPPQA